MSRRRRDPTTLVSVREAASFAAVDVVTVYDWIHDGRLPSPRRTVRGAVVPRFIPAAALAALLLPIDAHATLFG